MAGYLKHTSGLLLCLQRLALKFLELQVCAKHSFTCKCQEDMSRWLLPLSLQRFFLKQTTNETDKHQS